MSTEPRATYRLQLRSEFRFAEAADLIPYLAELGISHVYSSPVLQAVPGSTHGYDVVDHAAFSAELGGEAGFSNLVAALRAHGMGLLLDIVPNHMAIASPANRWWGDVLTHGRQSRHAPAFDIDWQPSEPPMRDTILGYRRFFDVDTLIGLRVEDPAVYEATHELILAQVRAGAVDGLRVDHPDGMRDPTGYFERLRAEAPDAWLLAEKILAPDEALPEAWPIEGTTGYDFANLALGLFVDPAGEAPLTELYQAFIGETASWDDVARASKLLVLHDRLGSDLNRLAALFLAICEADRRHRDYTRHELREALTEVLASFEVYRTYVRAESNAVTDTDARRIRAAVAGAAAHRSDMDPELFDFLERILTLRYRGAGAGELAMRFQQLSGPAMAKGVEDTAFYRYNRFVALNEVGGDPGRFGRSVDEFHAWCASASRRTILAGTTHDTKRGEDVRARLVLLSQLPGEWRAAVERWSALADRFRTAGLPDRNAEYLLYQTLVGAWPISVERAVAYAQKAAREAKLHTSWTAPDERYETALESFVHGLLDDSTFIDDVGAFVETLEDAARRTSLSLLLLRLTAPGVPDIYQGSELWDRSLVDPDNRRPVDFEARRRLLGEVMHMSAVEAWDRAAEGVAKLWLLQHVLALRARRPEAFDGSYQPLVVEGAMHDRVVAFVRDGSLAIVAPALVVDLDAWADTALPLPDGQWHDVLGDRGVGGRVPLAELLATFPVALLERR